VSSESRSIPARLFAHRSARWSLAVIGLLVIAAVVGPAVRGIGCNEQLDIELLKNAPPSWRFPLGTDAFSRDLLVRVLCGARISLSVGALAALLATTLGAVYGLTAGYLGGRADAVMMRLLDAFMSIPRVLLLIALLTIRHHTLIGVIVLIGITGWFAVSRLVRAEVMVLRESDFITAARAGRADAEDSLAALAAERRGPGHRQYHPGRRKRHRPGGGIVVPRHRCAAAHRELGRDLHRGL